MKRLPKFLSPLAATALVTAAAADAASAAPSKGHNPVAEHNSGGRMLNYSNA